MALKTALTDLLKIDHPVLCAPMAGVTGGKLAAAVSEAGGLGLLGGGYSETDWVARELREAGNSRIGAGFITWALDKNPSLVDAVLAHSPAAMMFSFGEITPYAAKVKQAGAALICQVQSVAQARQVADQGAEHPQVGEPDLGAGPQPGTHAEAAVDDQSDEAGHRHDAEPADLDQGEEDELTEGRPRRPRVDHDEAGDGDRRGGGEEGVAPADPLGSGPMGHRQRQQDRAERDRGAEVGDDQRAGAGDPLVVELHRMPRVAEAAADTPAVSRPRTRITPDSPRRLAGR